MDYWPALRLTDYEKQFVDVYTQLDSQGRVVKPGVLRRCYTLTLASQEQRAKNIPGIATIAQVQISRRARILGMTFTGNTDAWRLSVRNSNGTTYTNPTARGQKFPVVSSLIAGSYYNAAALGGKIEPLAYNHASNITDAIGPNPGFTSQFIAGQQSFPWLIEPNWVCQPNETIIFQGEDISPTWGFTQDANGPTSSTKLPVVLRITVFAWEFPGMKF